MDTQARLTLSTPRYKLSLCRWAEPCGVGSRKRLLYEFSRTPAWPASAPAVASFCLLANGGGAPAASDHNGRGLRARGLTAPPGRS
jgi:hypothetical protein